MPAARWKTVPYQVFDKPFPVTVVADDPSGISFVIFYFLRQDGMIRGIHVAEGHDLGGHYTAEVEPLENEDGLVGVDAYVSAKDGTLRKLCDSEGKDIGEKTLKLWSNKLGTLPNTQPDQEVFVDPQVQNTGFNAGTREYPYASIEQCLEDRMANVKTFDHLTVHLFPGEYTYYQEARRFGTSSGWITFTKLPEESLDSVVFTTRGEAEDSYEGMREALVHLKDISIRSKDRRGVLSSNLPESYLWLDGCSVSSDMGNYTKTFVTGCELFGTKDGVVNAAVCCNTWVHDIQQVAYQMCSLIVDCCAVNIQGSGDLHPDVVHLYGLADNILIIRLIAKDGIHSRGISGGPRHSHVAISDCDLDNLQTATTTVFSFYDVDTMIVRDCKFNGSFSWNEDGRDHLRINVEVSNVYAHTFHPPRELTEGVAYHKTFDVSEVER